MERFEDLVAKAYGNTLGDVSTSFTVNCEYIKPITIGVYMANIATITVQLRWDATQPDGSQCELCGDACYLTMFSAVVIVDGEESPIEPAVVLCGSCGDEQSE